MLGSSSNSKFRHDIKIVFLELKYDMYELGSRTGYVFYLEHKSKFSPSKSSTNMLAQRRFQQKDERFSNGLECVSYTDSIIFYIKFLSLLA